MTLEEANKYADEMDKLNDEREEFIKKLTRVRCSDKHREFIEWLLTEETEEIPCDTCGYEEGSIYCKEYCPHEAKIEQEPSGDAISRKIISAFLSGLISDETERKKALEYINELPPVVHLETVTEFADRCEECGKMRKGHWIDNHNGTISCDHCNTWFNKDDRYGYMHYCPYCNTKMESEG